MFTNIPLPLKLGQKATKEELEALARQVTKHSQFIGKLLIKERKGFCPSIVVIPKWADKLEEALNEAGKHFENYDVDIEEPPQP